MEPDFDAIIVGADPAGCAAALQLERRDPTFAGRTLLLDGAVCPRDEVCGGVLVPQTDRLLAQLEIPADGPGALVRSVRFHYPGGSADASAPQVFQVVRRDVLEESLLRQVKKRGVLVRAGEPVSTLTREGDTIRLDTPGGGYRARVVIGADGGRSRVRRELVGPACGKTFLALETLMPDASASDEAIFDFRPMAQGLHGYAWEFPCIARGQRCVNRGIGGSRWPAGLSLRDLFAADLLGRGRPLERSRLDAWSAPLYHPGSPQGARGALLAGDAVGVASWLGERIAMAVETGILAADAASDGLSSGRLDFSDHDERVRACAAGCRTERSLAAADLFCAPPARSEEIRGLADAAV